MVNLRCADLNAQNVSMTWNLWTKSMSDMIFKVRKFSYLIKQFKMWIDLYKFKEQLHIDECVWNFKIAMYWQIWVVLIPILDLSHKNMCDSVNAFILFYLNYLKIQKDFPFWFSIFCYLMNVEKLIDHPLLKVKPEQNFKLLCLLLISWWSS